MDTYYPSEGKRLRVREACLLQWMNLARISAIVAVLVRHGAGYLLCAVARRWSVLRRLCPHPLAGPDRLRLVFEELGGTFIKFGQMLALQPDILSLEYCNALFDLLDRVSPLSFPAVERVFQEELGCRPCDAFDSIDPVPLATASIGQVHVARLNGRKLAVKIQRPSVRNEFGGDIRLMAGMIRTIRILHLRPLQWMIEPLSEFVAWTREELDYRHEASYMRQLRQNSHGNPRECVPEVLNQFTTGRTLVMEFLEGDTLLAYLRAVERGEDALARRLKDAGFDSNVVAANIIDNFLGDVFRHGMFHADLHPANLMILRGNVVGYIDFGITGTISRYSRENLVALTLAYTRGDLDGMCESFFRVSTMGSGARPDDFSRELKSAAKNWYEGDGRQLHLKKNFTLVMLDMLTLSRSTGIWPERDVIKYIRSAIAIDGLITRFAPAFNLSRHLGLVCEQFLKVRFQDSLLSFDTMSEWMGSMGRLSSDGVFRAIGFMKRTADGSLRVQVDGDGRASSSRSPRRRVIWLGAAISLISLMILSSGKTAEVGINLFTTALALLCIALAMLLRTVRKLERG